MDRVLDRVRRIARRLRREAPPPPAPVPAPAIPVHVGEITPCAARAAADRGPRLNLLLPSINAQHYFGGIHTAVVLYRALCAHFPRSRIVLMDSVPDAAALARFPDHALAPADEESEAARQVTPFSDRNGRTLPVEPQDVFLATAWWTAHAAQRLQQWQQQHLGTARQLAYLIQDFEPGFYPWSSQSALALATYRPDRDLGIFNTQLLADYFAMQGLRYARAWAFEPTLNQGLRRHLAEAAARGAAPRDRRIVVYGRPSTPRNGFELICEALRHWGATDPDAARWEIVAPGEIATAIDLGPVRVQALGKLQIDEYAKLLATSAVGLSIMISPHPSYPPLEMAAFGMRVVTNAFANKDLSRFSANIRSVGSVAPEAIAAALASACAEHERAAGAPAAAFGADHPFLAEEGFSELAAQVARAWS